MKITEILETLLKEEHFNKGELVEIAKGKNEYITTFKDFKNKVKRLWRLKK